MSARLPSMKLPVLVVNGAHDMSLDAGKFTASQIPGARHVTLEGAGHACNIEAPEAFEAAVIEFLQGQGLWRGS